MGGPIGYAVARGRDHAGDVNQMQLGLVVAYGSLTGAQLCDYAVAVVRKYLLLLQDNAAQRLSAPNLGGPHRRLFR